jgi:WD40 repeat protein
LQKRGNTFELKEANMSTVSKGKEFEDQVAELYRLMGYEVAQNVGILGHQIDIILTYTMPGGIKTKTAVECKYVEKGNLEKNNVIENINSLINLKISGEVQNLIIITTNGFAKDIWDTAKANQIQLLTFRELQHQILKLDQYLDRLIKNYETDELSKYYIDLIAQDDEKMPTKIFEPMDDYVNQWTNDETTNHLSILGEYGTGKTSFCRKLAHDLAMRYNKDPLNNRIPILINLRDYSKVMSVRQLITDLLINEYGLRGIDYPLFEKMNEEGLFLMIFDGFDEMAQKVLFDVAYSNFTKIAELAKPKKSKVILTCRTEFFRTHEKEKEVLLDVDKRKNFNIIYLREFNDEQIKKFLQKRVPLIEAEKEKKQGWKYYYEKIQNVFDLKDLAKRPVLLDLITKYLPQLIEKGETINASTLYQTAIQEELKRRLTVGKTVIEREDRLKLMKLLAMWMYNHDEFSIYYEKIPKLLDLEKNFDLKTRTDTEYHLHDFLTCSFLSRDPDGNYRFSHKSFVDFLVAWKFTDNIKDDLKYDFMNKQVTYEVMQFMKDFEINRERLYQWIDFTREKSFSYTKYLGGNAVSILNELGEDFAKNGFDFSETLLDYANFHGQNLRGINFQKASLKNANLNNTILKDSDFSNANLEGASLEVMGELFDVAFSPDGKCFAGAGSDYNIRVWNVATLKEITTLKGHAGYVLGVAFSPDGKYLVSSSADQTIKVWNVATLKQITTLKGHTDIVWGVTFSPDGKFLVSASWDKTIKVWDVATLKEIATLKGHTHSVRGVAFSPDGKFLASSSADQTINIWDVATLKQIITLKGDTDSGWGIAFSPDGKYLASGGSDGSIKVWNVATLKQITTLKGDTDSGWGVAFSPDGKYLASGVWDGSIKVWNVATLNGTTILKGHTSSAVGLAFNPDSAYLASTGSDGTIKVWDVATLKEITTLKGHTFPVRGVAFSPDGEYLASASDDCSIRLWATGANKKDFGKCLHVIKQQINCKGMKIKGIRGLDREGIEFLKERGAIE